jgi:branched-chain amino acid aminotransferase
MDKVEFIWMNGEFMPWDEAKVHVLSHAIHYGSGVFEGVRFYETEDGRTAVFRMQDHTKRFFYSANVLQMKFPYTEEQINEVTLEIIRKNKVKKGYIRPLAIYGYGKMGLNPHGAKIDVAIAVWPWESYLGEESIKVKTSKYVRIHPDSTDMKAKISGHYVNSILSSFDAQDNGFHEALLLDYEGNVAEGPGENVFAVKDGKLVTPKEGNILVGLTRESIFEIAKNEGIEIIEKTMTLDELKDADEAFFTGTAAEVTPIRQIDDKIIGNGKIGPITGKLKTIFTDAIHGKIPEYSDWLTYV